MPPRAKYFACVLPYVLLTSHTPVLVAGKHAFIGMGFTDRSHAFDFNAAIQDFRRELNAEKEAAAKPKDEGPKLDLTLKEGQTIKVKIGGAKGGGAKKKAPAPSASGDDFFGGLLAPPPVRAAPILRGQYALSTAPGNLGSCAVWYVLAHNTSVPCLLN